MKVKGKERKSKCGKYKEMKCIKGKYKDGKRKESKGNGKCKERKYKD